MYRTILLILALAFSILSAQKYKAGDAHLTLGGGLGLTDFEMQSDAGGALEVAATVGFNVIDFWELGIDISSTVSPFSLKTDIDEQTYEENISQHVIGIYTQLYFLNKRTTKGFVKGALGFYLGEWERKFAGETDKSSLEPTLGYSLGIGFYFDEGFMLQATYHFVTRTPSDYGSESFGANNLSLMVGYQFQL